MKKFLLSTLAAVLLAISCFGQGPSQIAGVYNSLSYNGTWSVKIALGTNGLTGSQTITLAQPYAVLPDGRLFNPFSTTVPLTIGAGTSVSEVVTPSAVSGCGGTFGSGNLGGGTSTCQITATFSNAHGVGEVITTGSQGIQDAIQDATNNGGGMVYWQIDPGSVTLSTGGANTNLGSIAIPTRSVVMGAVGRVTTTIGTCAGGWSLGFSTGTEFGAANTTLTAGTTTDSSTISAAVTMTAAATVPIAHCTTSNASAGAIHARFWGYKFAAPGF